VTTRGGALSSPNATNELVADPPAFDGTPFGDPTQALFSGTGSIAHESSHGEHLRRPRI